MYNVDNFYPFYKNIPSSYRYLFVKGFAYAEIMNRVGEYVLWQPENIGNFNIIDQYIQSRINSLPDNDEQCIKDIYTAYISMMILEYTTLYAEDDYYAFTLSLIDMKQYFLKIRDKNIIDAITFRLEEEMKMYEGNITEEHIRFSIHFIKNLSKLHK